MCTKKRESIDLVGRCRDYRDNHAYISVCTCLCVHVRVRACVSIKLCACEYVYVCENKKTLVLLQQW